MIEKTFTQVYVAHDCEARDWDWENTSENYEVKKEELREWNGWYKAVRIVKKVFDEDTFTITEYPIKEATRAYKGYQWLKGEIEEEIF